MENVSLPDLPKGSIPKARYAPIIHRIAAANGDWVKIDLSELSGRYPVIKQARLLQAATRHGVKITTTFKVQGGCYARLLTSADREVPR